MVTVYTAKCTRAASRSAATRTLDPATYSTLPARAAIALLTAFLSLSFTWGQPAPATAEPSSAQVGAVGQSATEAGAQAASAAAAVGTATDSAASAQVATPVAGFSAQDSLTLTDCIQVAKDASPALAQQRTSLAKSNISVESARSSYYPSADFSSSIRNSEGYGGDRQTSYSSSVGLSYSVYEGGYRRASVDAARAKVEVTKEQYRLSQDQLVLQVKEAFFRILQKQEQTSLVEDVAKRRNDDLVLIRLRYEAGRESSPAVKESEASLLQAQYDMERAREELAQAKVELNLLLGRAARAELALKYEEKDSDFPAVATLIERAKQERPELRSEKANRPALEAQVTQAKSSYLPKVSFSTSYSLSGDEFTKQTGGWGAGLSLSLPIFDGYSRKAQLSTAKLSLENQTDVLRELELQVVEDVESAYSTWKLARDIVQVTEKTLEAAREMYLLTKMQYEQGSTSYFFLQQKEAGLTGAETSRLSALLNVRVSAARLEKTLGRVN